MSPGRKAPPPGIFSAMASTPTTLALAFLPAMARMAPSTAAAPPMSPFISSICSAGLIERPPLSKVSPLPTSTSGLSSAALPCQRNTAKMGARVLPCPTAASRFRPCTVGSSSSTLTPRLSKA